MHWQWLFMLHANLSVFLKFCVSSYTVLLKFSYTSIYSVSRKLVTSERFGSREARDVAK